MKESDDLADVPAPCKLCRKRAECDSTPSRCRDDYLADKGDRDESSGERPRGRTI